jgi:molybdopterin-guanine dinucleotide biosynthesis protein A
MNSYPKASITGVILAGGRAERMGGQDKGLLLLSGQPMIGYALRALRPQVAAVLINANRNLAVYQALGCQVVSDSKGSFCGPLAGMLAALEFIISPYVLIIPCDSPLLPADYACRMYAALAQEEAELSVAWDGQRLQPVFALLKAGLRASLQHYLDSGERKIDRWFARHRMARADFSDNPTMFHNINTLEELARLERVLSRPSG